MSGADFVGFDVVFLLLLAAVGGWAAWKHARVAGPYPSVRSLVLLNAVLIGPLSGAAHLGEFGSTRGYIDILNFGQDYIARANAAIAVGLVFLILGCGYARRDPAPVRAPLARWAGPSDPRITLLLLAVIGPLSLYGVLQISAISGEAALVRVIALTGGTARYGFLSHWAVWSATFLAVYMINRSPDRPFVVLAWAGLATLVIAAVLQWTGGRSIVILMAFPVLVYAWPLLGRARTLAFVAGAAVAIVYVVYVSKVRSSSLQVDTGVDLGNWLDWEWGRYSLMATSIQFVDANGYLWGSTFATAANFTLTPILNILGLSAGAGWETSLTSMDIASRLIFGNFDIIYIVPGATAELYVNFGLVGVACGYLLLGYLARWTDRALANSRGTLQKLLLFYVAALLIFRVIPADSSSLWIYLLYSGLPLIVAAGLSSMLLRRRRRRAGAAGVVARLA